MRSWEAFSPVERVAKHWKYLQENVRVPVREGVSGGVQYGKYDMATRESSSDYFLLYIKLYGTPRTVMMFRKTELGQA